MSTTPRPVSTENRSMSEKASLLPAKSMDKTLCAWIRRAMIAFGDARPPFQETVYLIECDCRSYVRRVSQRAAMIAAARGGNLTAHDIIHSFVQIYSDSPILLRLEHFLQWREQTRVEKIVGEHMQRVSGNDNDPSGASPNNSSKSKSGSKDSKSKEAKTAAPLNIPFQSNRRSVLSMLPAKRCRYMRDFISALAEFPDDNKETLEGVQCPPMGNKPLLTLSLGEGGITSKNDEATARAHVVGALRSVPFMAYECAVKSGAAGLTDPVEMENYEKCRDTSFLYGIPRKIREWCELALIRHDDDVVDVMAYLVWERIALVTQTALIARDYSESKSAEEDLWSPPTMRGEAIFKDPLYKKYAERSKKKALLPRHIYEALRRLRVIDNANTVGCTPLGL